MIVNPTPDSDSNDDNGEDDSDDGYDTDEKTSYER